MCACIHLFHLAVGMISACIVAGHLLSPWAGVSPWGSPRFYSKPPSTKKGFGVPSKMQRWWGKQPRVGISTLTSTMGSPWESRNTLPARCAVPVVKEVKIRQRCGIRNTDLYEVLRDHQCTAKISQPNGWFPHVEGKKSSPKNYSVRCFCILKLPLPVFSKFGDCWENNSCDILCVAFSKAVSYAATWSVSLTQLDCYC